MLDTPARLKHNKDMIKANEHDTLIAELRSAAPRIARQRYFFWLPLVEDVLIRVQRRTGHALSDEDFRKARDWGLWLVGQNGLPACLPR